jgi:GntR family transcriptional regulator/MocR family aminotransferase
MRIPLDRQEEKPLYRQIHDFLRREILTGALQEDAKLPSTRGLASELGVSRITVSNAYAELEVEGLIYTRLGSGTYVAPGVERILRDRERETTLDHWPLWQQNLVLDAPPTPSRGDRIAALTASVEGTISFAPGIGAKEIYPIRGFFRAVQDVLRRDGSEAMCYGATEGYLPLRATVSHILSSQGMPTYPEDVLITSGSQQAMALVANLLLRPGDAVLLENPTYSGAMMVFRALGARMVGIPVDQEGMKVGSAESLLRTIHPSLIYTVPTFHNPTGTCLSTSRRHQLIQLAGAYNVPVVEDDFAGDLRYDGQSKPALRTIDPGGMVIYIGTFSKVLMPALRVGYIVASGPVLNLLRKRKRMTDLGTSTLIQRALETYVTVGRYESYLNRAKRLYRERRDAMEAAIAKHMPEGMTWVSPHGGLFIWLRLPEDVSANDLYPIAVQEGVSYGPGSLFFHDREDSPCMRLNFTLHPPERIEEGILRLARALDRYQDPGSSKRVVGAPPDAQDRDHAVVAGL